MAKAPVKGKRQLALRVRCGSCKYLHLRNKKFDAPCRDLGKNSRSACCDQYTPDYTQHVRGVSPEVVLSVARALRGVSDEQKQVLAYALVNERDLQRITNRVRGVDMYIGHPVAVRVGRFQPDTVDQWARGFVMGITRDGKYLEVCAKYKWTQAVPKKRARGLGKVHWIQCFLPVDCDTLLTRAQWEKHKKNLVKQGHISCKKMKQYLLQPITQKEAEQDDYVPPSLAHAPPDWLAPYKAPADVGAETSRTYIKEGGGVYRVS